MDKFSNKLKKEDIFITALNSELVYIVESGSQVGSLVLIYDINNKASVFSLEVLQSHRKKGYGKKLMEKAIQRCKERNCKSIELNTEIDNTPANNLYKSIGFELQESLKFGFNNYIKHL